MFTGAASNVYDTDSSKCICILHEKNRFLRLTLLREKEYDEFCKKINDVQETIKMVKFRTAQKRFWEFLQIYEWYIKKIDGSCFTLNQEFKKYQVKLQKNNKGIIETFDSLSEWCS